MFLDVLCISGRLIYITVLSESGYRSLAIIGLTDSSTSFRNTLLCRCLSPLFPLPPPSLQ